MVAPLAQHACLPAGEDEGGGQETSGGPTAETQAASGGGAGLAGQATGGAEAEHELEGRDPNPHFWMIPKPCTSPSAWKRLRVEECFSFLGCFLALGYPHPPG